MDVSSAHQQLLQLLKLHSFREGHFVLASGATSSFYVDARKTTMHPAGLRLIGFLGLQVIRDEGWHADAVGGLTLGADPVAYAIALTSAVTTDPLRSFTVRKEAKTHGTGQLIEGPFRPGDRCVVVEDVITTGSSALRAADAIQNAGGSVLGVLAVVDREEGGRDFLKKHGLKSRSLVTLSELRSVAG